MSKHRITKNIVNKQLRDQHLKTHSKRNVVFFANVQQPFGSNLFDLMFPSLRVVERL